MSGLPLSWSIINSSQLAVKDIRRWNLTWLALRNIPATTFKIGELISPDSKTLIRGCNTWLADELESKGFAKFQFGMEAVLNTDGDHFKKKSLLKLVKRGLSKGKIISPLFNEENVERLNTFKYVTVHGFKPQLTNLFQTQFQQNHKLFVFENFKKEWLAAILVSRNSAAKLHTELLLRRKDAPTGAMEVLVHHTFQYAQQSGYDLLSLGEVPFKYSNDSKKKTIFKLLNVSGKIFKFAYNHEGLYNFKNKFSPQWNSLYICTTQKIGPQHLLLIMIESNFHKLLLTSLLKSITAFVQSLKPGVKLVK